MTESKQNRDLAELGPYVQYAKCVVCLVVENQSGDLSTGAAFHIGDGLLVTARHVLEGRTIREAIAHHLADLSIESFRVMYPADGDVDLAIIQSDFSLAGYMSDRYTIYGFRNESKVDYIELGTHLDDWIDDSMVLMDVIVLGYPIIPTSRDPVAR